MEPANLEGLNKGVEEDSNADAPAQQLDQPSGAEELEETNLDELGDVNDASHNRDEVKNVPRLFEVVLEIFDQFLRILVLRQTFGPKDDSFRTHSIVKRSVKRRLK